MAQELPIEAVRNRKTQKLFIVIDDTLGTRFKVLNPEGEMLVLPDLLFDEDMITVQPDQFGAEFTAQQLTALREFQEKAEAQARAAAERPAPPPRVTIAAPAKKPTSSAKRAPKVPERRGLGATWSSPRLTFYKHKIEPLHPKQTFRVTVEGVGTFEISKEDFLAQFNDAVMSPSYRADGLYTYPQIPEKAKRYLKT